MLAVGDNETSKSFNCLRHVDEPYVSACGIRSLQLGKDLVARRWRDGKNTRKVYDDLIAGLRL